MNSSTIAAVVPGLKPQPGNAATPDTADTDAKQSFATVLAGQSPETVDDATRANGATTPADDVAGEAHVLAGRNKAPDEHDPEHALEPDALEPDFALPGIALEIALHARNQAAARANPVSSDAGSSTQGRDLLIDASANAARAGAGGLKTVTAAVREAIASGQTRAEQTKAETTTLADARGTAAASLSSGMSPLAGASDLGRGLAAGAATRRAAPTTLASSTVAAAAATGRQATAQAGNTASQRNAADITAITNVLAQALDKQPAVPNGHSRAAGELSVATSGAPINPFTLAGTGPAIAGPAIATPVHQPGWNADFSRQVVTLAHNAHSGTQTAELRLDPPELGPLRISISLNEGMASALFVSAHASVRHAIESALPQLSQQLAQAGISLGDTQVGEHGQEGFAFNDDAGRQHGRASSNGAAGATTLASDPIPAPGATIASNNLVDTFA